MFRKPFIEARFPNPNEFRVERDFAENVSIQ